MPRTAGYSGKPLAKKLGIAASTKVHVVNPPANYIDLLEPLPEGSSLVKKMTESTDLLHVFVTARSKLQTVLKSAPTTLSRCPQ